MMDLNWIGLVSRSGFANFVRIWVLFSVSVLSFVSVLFHLFQLYFLFYFATPLRCLVWFTSCVCLPDCFHLCLLYIVLFFSPSLLVCTLSCYCVLSFPFCLFHPSPGWFFFFPLLLFALSWQIIYVLDYPALAESFFSSLLLNTSWITPASLVSFGPLPTWYPIQIIFWQSYLHFNLHHATSCQSSSLFALSHWSPCIKTPLFQSVFAMSLVLFCYIQIAGILSTRIQILLTNCLYDRVRVKCDCRCPLMDMVVAVA